MLQKQVEMKEQEMVRNVSQAAMAAATGGMDMGHPANTAGRHPLPGACTYSCNPYG